MLARALKLMQHVLALPYEAKPDCEAMQVVFHTCFCTHGVYSSCIPHIVIKNDSVLGSKVLCKSCQEVHVRHYCLTNQPTVAFWAACLIICIMGGVTHGS